MEAPGGLATNICCLGKVASVSWISYTWTPQDGSSADNSRLGQMHLAELAIRRVGGFSLFDPSQHCLWIFDISLGRSSKNPRYTGLDDAIALANSFGLQEVKRGTLLSHGQEPGDEGSNDINIHGKREWSDDMAGILKANAIIMAKNHHLDVSLGHKKGVILNSRPGEPLQADLLYAIQSSCILELERSRHLTGLGNGLFCRPDCTEFDSSPASPDLILLGSSRSRALWSLDVAWHGTGAILVSYNQVDNKVVLNSGDAESDIVLAPFGWNARILPVRSLNGNASESGEHHLGQGHMWRSQCLDLLQQYGLEAQNYSEWTAVKVQSVGDSDIDFSIEWPRQLCLHIANFVAGPLSLDVLERSEDTTWTDPFQEIVGWMSDTREREKLVKEQLLNKSSTSKVRPSKIIAEEEVLAHLQSRYEETLDAQAVAGIYPTPPDASKGHGQMHTETTPSLLNQTTEFYSDATANGDASGAPPPMQEDQLESDSYDPFKGNDLFDDMDTGMDGDNGVTEDDFRFFDEPDEIGGLEATPEPSVVLDRIVHETPANISDNSPQATPENVQELEIESMAEQQINATAIIPSENVSSPASVSMVSDVVTAEAEHVEELQQDASPQTFDAKYSASGKYAWDKVQKPLTSTPYTRIKQDKGIPLVRGSILISPSTTNSPTSESFQESYHVQASTENDSEETILFREQGHLLSKLMTEYKSSGVKEYLDASSKSLNKDSSLPEAREVEFQGQATVQLAQIVADQSIFYEFLVQEHGHRTSSQILDGTAELVGSMLQQCFPDSEALNLQQCTRLQTDPAASEESSPFFDVLSPPIVRVKRAGAVMDLSHSALRFWKELSIKPLHGPKDVTAICLYQEGNMYQAGALSFLQSMEDSYRSLNLGSHSAGHNNLKSYPGGLVPVPNMNISLVNGKFLSAFCNQLGKSLSALCTNQEAIVIYIVQAFEDGVSLTNLCSLFQKIFESYASVFRKADKPADLILQLIPPFMATSDMSKVFSNLKHCATISKIIYDRCPTTNSLDSVYVSASMLQLAQPLPTSIDFKLSPDNPLSPMATHQTFHLAYSYTERSPWLSAALVDVYGSKQWSASYFLGESSKRPFVLPAVANEIWEIIRLAAGYRRTYDIAIVKTTDWTAEEIGLWKNLAQRSKIFLSLLRYDIDCPIKLRVFDHATSIDALEAELVVVPPTPDVSSPDPTGGRAEEQDSVVRLVDARNQVWWAESQAIVTKQNDSLEIEECSHAGYFVDGSHKVTSLYVVDTTHAVELAAVAEAYHGLSLLAQVRCAHQHLPWHIAIAEGAQSGLERYLNNCKVV